MKWEIKRKTVEQKKTETARNPWSQSSCWLQRLGYLPREGLPFTDPWCDRIERMSAKRVEAAGPVLTVEIIDWLERLVSEMMHYVPSGTLFASNQCFCHFQSQRRNPGRKVVWNRAISVVCSLLCLDIPSWMCWIRAAPFQGLIFNPFSASCSKSLLFKRFSTILVF